MPGPSTGFLVEIDGAPLPEELSGSLVRVVVEDSLHLPDAFVLTFQDPDHGVLAAGGLEIGAEVTLSVPSTTGPGAEELLTGEVTALEIEHDGTGTWASVRGYDHSHRLFREPRTESYENADHAEIVRTVASRVGLKVGTIDAAPGLPVHVSQIDTTDWAFLWRLARDIGFEVAVVDGELHFRRPPESSRAPDPAADLDAVDPLQLKLGSELLRLRASLSSAQQVTDVEVRGWDVQQKRELVGEARATTTSASIGVQPAELAERFGGPRHVTGQRPHGTQQAVDAAAAAVAEQIAGSFVELDGLATGNPRLRAGTAVSLGLAGEPFDGRYTLTTCRHTWDPDEGYTTAFRVTGRQDRSLLGLTGGGSGAVARQHGATVGIVTDIDDPDRLGRVKLTLPRLSDTYVTDWTRIVFPDAGRGRAGARGMTWLPEVNDEVLVCFEHGEVGAPYVLGGLYNGVDRPFPDAYVDASRGTANERFLRSRKGHELRLVDQDGEETIVLRSGDGNNTVELSRKDKQITVAITDGDVVIDAGGNGKLTVTTGGDATVTATGNAKVSAQRNLELESQGQLSVKGNGGVKIESPAVVEIKASLLKLN